MGPQLVASSNPAVKLTVQRTVPFARKVTTPMAVDGNPVSERLIGELEVIVNVDDGMDEELRTEIVKLVCVVTVNVTEFDDVEPQ